MKTVNVNLKKKTIQNAIGQLDMLTQMDLSAHRKGDPIYELVMEVKRDIKRQMRKPKINAWKEFFDFWPLSICVPVIFIIYMWGLFNY